MKLRDYQEEAVAAVFREWKTHDSTLLVAATGTGKCLAPDTPVLMFNGTIKTAREVKEGDCLMGADSRARVVLSTGRGRERMYRITPTKGESYCVNESHILSLKMTSGGKCARFADKSIVNISVKDYLSQNKTFHHRAKGYRVGVDFNPQDVDLAPYFLGLWLGDGDSHGTAITTIDPEVIVYLDHYAKELDLHLSVYAYSDRTPSYSIAGIRKKANPILNALRGYGLLKNKHIPRQFLVNNRWVRRQLLAGIIDTDGHLSDGGYDVVFKSQKLADDTTFLARSLGLAAYVKPCRKTCTNNGVEGDYFRIFISGDVSMIPVRIARKKATPRKQKKDVLVTGVKVEPIGIGEYCGWELDGDGLFLLGDFTVTHNTQVFSEIIYQMRPGRALVLAHRGELIWQAAKRIEGLGLETSIEMAELSAGVHMWNETPVVISTIQTQIAGRNNGRMSKFEPNNFSLVIIDEAHHATSPTYRRVIDYYRQNPYLKILGVTATPDRADEEALGQVFQSVAFDYEILDAINGGWLVPVKQQMVTIDGLDFSQIRTTAGDLNGADLAAVMEAEKNLHGIVSASLDIIGERRTLVFAVTVKQAEKYCEIFNRHKPGIAEWVCGKTPKDQRHETFRKFSNGDIQILTNVGVATEGYDNPGVEVIVQARPTKSRCLYSQMVGRATRTLPGIVDQYETAEERREAIAQSQKPTCLVVDFVGNSGRHKLMTTADILGGRVSELAVARVMERAKAQGQAFNMAAELEQEEKQIKSEVEERKARETARRAHVVGHAQYSTRQINPFDTFELTPIREKGYNNRRAFSEKQANILRKQGIDPNSISFGQGCQLVGEFIDRFKRQLCTWKQAKILQEKGYTKDEVKNLTMTEASTLIDKVARNGWRRV